MTEYLKQAHPAATPQSQPLSGQTLNEAGGYTWEVDAFARLRRWLILGSEGDAYYVGQQKLTRENVTSVLAALDKDGARTVQEIVEVSRGGRAPKNDPAVFALALAATEGDPLTRELALRMLPEVCRIGTHLFQFCEYVQLGRGWGRTLRRAVAAWYETQDADKLAYQLIKYRQRGGWTHRDVLRLAHPKATTNDHRLLYDFACGREVTAPGVVEGYLRAQGGGDDRIADLIREYDLPREAIPTEALTDPEVWEALLEKMPMTAMIRNLANMTRCGLIAPSSEAAKTVRERLQDADRLKRARVHPMNVLMAALTYVSGRGLRGQNTWTPVTSVADALDDAFYASFANVTPTGKRLLIAIDSSGSMHGGEVNGVPGFHPVLAAVAQALVFAATEPDAECISFDTRYQSFPLSSRQRLDDALKTFPFLGGGTDCAQAFAFALDHKRELDGFIVLTDNQTWQGRVHPAEALQHYRRTSQIADARLAAVALVPYSATIVRPEDPLQMDFVGFDAAVPELLGGFMRGEF